MRRAIIMVLDGLRRDMINAELTPNLARLAGAAESFASHRSVFPSATRVVSSSMATGCYPARHELAGNSTALLENGRLVAHDAGDPNFLQHKRAVTGQSLAMPTLAERVKDHGGAIIYANVSPGPPMHMTRTGTASSITGSDRMVRGAFASRIGTRAR
ncbi:MAG: alkaline phosphatase family protein [Hyphomicrobiaceae bacterium]